MKLLFEDSLFSRLEKRIDENETTGPIRKSLDGFVLSHAKTIRTIIGVLFFAGGTIGALCAVVFTILSAVGLAAATGIEQGLLGLALVIPMGLFLAGSVLSFFLGHRLIYRKKAYAKLFVNISIISFGISVLTLITSPTLFIVEIIPLCIAYALNLLFWHVVHLSTQR